MKKKHYKHKSPIKKDFIYWLSHDNGSLKRYLPGTAIAYADRLSRFCNKFFLAKKEEPLVQFAHNIETSMMCCCLCTALKEPNEMLKTEEIRVLANAFFYYRVSKDQSTAHHKMFKDDLFEKMVIYLCRKKSGNEYQKVIELFYDFLKDTKFDDYSTLYEEIEERLEELRKDDSVFWKYGYIEATRRTPAMIIARAGQVGIPVSALTKIFKCDYRTIKRMLKKNNITSCHHRRGSVSIGEKDCKMLQGYFQDRFDELVKEFKDRKCQLLLVSPPCQVFCGQKSKNFLKDPRLDLIVWVIKFIKKVKPKYIVIENARQFLNFSMPKDPEKGGDSEPAKNLRAALNGRTIGQYIKDELKDEKFSVI